MIHTRFAPSPTGYLHIGGVRTALFNFLYSRSQQGKFFLRIEDTDQERSRQEYELDIINSMRWLGLDWDGELIYQSKRLERYREVAYQLRDRSLAYTDESGGAPAIKFKMPRETVIFHDIVREEVKFDAALFDDLVILKSDGYPTYHFACVVDDHDMEITHVIRGEDHIPNTPRQILLFQALGWKPPKYAHLSLILGADGTPLSKRHGAVSLNHYHEEGFLPEALLNYLALLGWDSGDQQEIFRLEELIKKFSLKRITKSGARFNLEKLMWVNAQHIKKMDDEDYRKRITTFYEKEAACFQPDDWKRLTVLYKTRLDTFKDLAVQADYCFQEVEKYDEGMRSAFKDVSDLKQYLAKWVAKAEGFENFGDIKKIDAMTRDLAKELNVEAKILIHPLRFALTGKTISPGLFELMNVLGKDNCVKRVRKFVEWIQ